MGKSPSQKTYVTDYRMSIHFGVAWSLDAITEIRVNDKTAWLGFSDSKEIISINQPELFGGVQKEGGLVGAVLHLPGRMDQTIPDWMAQRFGLTEATMPAYRGITSLFFYGAQTGYTDEFDTGYVGGGTGFLWGSNQPIIAQQVAIRGVRAPAVLLPEKRLIGDRLDANPVYMIYEAMINDDWGMGTSEAAIDTQSFIDEGNTIYNEAFGMSIFWSKQTTIENIVAEIQDHIQATVFLSPQTGLWTIKLLRNDYDIESLPEINPDNAKLSNFRRAAWGELANHITVSYTDPANEEPASVSAQDLGSIANQGRVPASRDYYGVRDADLAMDLAERDVRTASAPLVNLDAEIDRRGWAALPGQCFRLNWPKYNISNMIVRAMGVSTGKPGDTKITLGLVQDIFSLSRGGINNVPPTGWEPPGEEPSPLAATEIITLPAYFSLSGDLQTQAVDLVYPEVLSAILGYQDGNDTTLFDVLSLGYTSTGAEDYLAQGARSVTERAIMPVAMPAEPVSTFLGGIVARPERGPRIGGFVFMGVGEDENMEIAQVIGRDVEAGTWTIARGVLDTVPRAWSIGTPMWFVNTGLRIVDETSPRAAGEEVTYKLLPRTSKGVLSEGSADPVSETMNARPHMPLRPANVKVNGTAYGPIAAGATSEFVVTWATRNRLLEDGQVVRWTDGSVAPEYTQASVVTVYDQDGVQVYQQPGLWTQEQHTLQASWFARYSAITVEITSHRRDDDLPSLQGHRITITGLPNNPAAPLPPGPVDTGNPPAPDAGPLAGNWAATGFLFDSTTGIKTPAIVVSGKRDRQDAIGLTMRYHKVGSTDVFVSKEVALSDDPTQIAESAVASQTTYAVEIAYRSTNNLLSQWTSLGTVTTGVLVAGDSLKLGDKVAAEWDTKLSLARTLADQGLAQARDALLRVQATLALIDGREYDLIKKLTPASGRPIGATIDDQIRIVNDTNGIIIEHYEEMIVGFDNAAAALSLEALVRAGEDEALAAYQIALAAVVDDNQASVTSTLTALSTDLGSLASDVETLSVDVGDNSATISITAIALATLAGQVAASYGVKLDVNGHVIGYEGINNGEEGGWIFSGDFFGIKTSSGGVKYPFYVSGSTVYLTDTVIDGDLLVTGTVSTPKMANSSISDNTISAASSTTYGTGYPITLFSQTFYLPYAARVRAEGDVAFIDGGGNGPSYHQSQLILYINGTQVNINTAGGVVATSVLAITGALEVGAGYCTVELAGYTKPDDYYTFRNLFTEWFYK